MKIIENNDKEDYLGRYPILTLKGSELARVADKLFSRFQGFKFAVLVDVYADEYPVPEKESDYEANVYFLDELFEEMIHYIGIKEAQEKLDKLKH